MSFKAVSDLVERRVQAMGYVLWKLGYRPPKSEDIDPDKPDTGFVIRRVVEDLVRRGQHEVGGDGLERGGDLVAVQGGSGDTTTERAALRGAAPAPNERIVDGELVEDPAQPDTWQERERDNVGQALADLVAMLAEAAGVLVTIDRKRAFVINVGAKAKGWEATVEKCYECNEPALPFVFINDEVKTGIKRLDGKPYHHPDVQPKHEEKCWWKAYNRKRRAC